MNTPEIVTASHALFATVGYDNGMRIRSAIMVELLARQFRVSQKQIQDFVQDHYGEFVKSGLYFEVASEGVIWFSRAESRRKMLCIDGMWMPSIRKTP